MRTPQFVVLVMINDGDTREAAVGVFETKQGAENFVDLIGTGHVVEVLPYDVPEHEVVIALEKMPDGTIVMSQGGKWIAGTIVLQYSPTQKDGRIWTLIAEGQESFGRHPEQQRSFDLMTSGPVNVLWSPEESWLGWDDQKAISRRQMPAQDQEEGDE